MTIHLFPSQYKLLARYTEDLSKTITLYNVAGYFLPSILPAAVKPTILQLIFGILLALTTLFIAIILEEKGEIKKGK